MERRVFIAIILSFLVLYAYQALFVRATPPATAAKPAAATAQTPVPAPAENAPAPSKGQVAATRNLGSAVERNRAKRRARELFRRRKNIGGLDIVIVPRREMLDAPFATLEADYTALLARHREPARRDARRPGVGARSGTASSL